MVDRAVLTTWANFDKRLFAWELENQGQRITQVMFNGADRPDYFAGVMSECAVVEGKPSVRLSTGDIIEI